MPAARDSGPKKLKALAKQAKTMKKRRAELGLTQNAAAAALGVTREAYLSYEHGTRAPRPAVRQSIVEAWGLDPKEMSLGVEGCCPSCGRPY